LTKKEYTDNELENLSWEEKCRLIQSDPITCARHFDFHRVLQNTKGKELYLSLVLSNELIRVKSFTMGTLFKRLIVLALEQ